MKRLLILVAALAGCADDVKDAKSEATCDSTWGTDSGKSCDHACVTKPEMTGASCETNVSAFGIALTCPMTITVNGETGCCSEIVADADATIGNDVADEPSRTRRVFFLTCK